MFPPLILWRAAGHSFWRVRREREEKKRERDEDKEKEREERQRAPFIGSFF